MDPITKSYPDGSCVLFAIDIKKWLNSKDIKLWLIYSKNCKILAQGWYYHAIAEDTTTQTIYDLYCPFNNGERSVKMNREEYITRMFPNYELIITQTTENTIDDICDNICNEINDYLC